MNQPIFLEIAGFNIKIIFCHEEASAQYFEKLKNDIIFYYGGFIVKKPSKRSDYDIHVKNQPLFLTMKRPDNKYYLQIFNKKNNKTIETTYKISIFELQYILKEIILLLLKNNGFIFHCSSIISENKVNIFTGKSGAGKSTAADILKENYQIFSDDTSIIKKEKKEYRLYQTPFLEKNPKIVKTNKGYLINKIFFLRKAKFFRIRQIFNKEIVISNTGKQLWSEKEYLKYHIKTLFKFIADSNNFYYLYFAKDKIKLNNLFYEI